jgi:hypothetical protein
VRQNTMVSGVCDCSLHGTKKQKKTWNKGPRTRDALQWHVSSGLLSLARSHHLKFLNLPMV